MAECRISFENDTKIKFWDLTYRCWGMSSRRWIHFVLAILFRYNICVVWRCRCCTQSTGGVHWIESIGRTVWSKAFSINLSLDGSVVVSAFRMLHRYFTLFSSQLTRKELKKNHFRINSHSVGRKINKKKKIFGDAIRWFDFLKKKKKNNLILLHEIRNTKQNFHSNWLDWFSRLFFFSLFFCIFILGFDRFWFVCNHFVILPASQFFFRRTKSFTIHSQLKKQLKMKK